MYRSASGITRIAMWSGPRNISTAMMYSFAARADTRVWDEPFYAFYLSHAGIEHPMQNEIIAAGEADWHKVIKACTTVDLDTSHIHYQKHMTHHMLPGYDRSWIAGLNNAFLIRHPERVLASYSKKRDEVTLNDIGFQQQAEIFAGLAEHSGTAPPVVDADDILNNPAGMLKALCRRLDIGFDEHMLSWPAGPKPYDGAWAPHWYNAAWQSTGFAQPSHEKPDLLDHHRDIANAALPFYQQLHQHRITI